MKKINYLPLGILSMFLFSCSVVKNDRFYSQKYTDFKKSKTEVVIAKPVMKHNIPAAVKITEVKQNKVAYNVNVSQTFIAAKNSNTASDLFPNSKMKKANKQNIQFHSNAKVNNETTASSKQKQDNLPYDNSSTTSSKKKRGYFSRAFPPADIVAVLLAILIPPLGVWYYEQGLTTNFWIDILLCLLFWVPGIVFALLIVLDVI